MLPATTSSSGATESLGDTTTSVTSTSDPICHGKWPYQGCAMFEAASVEGTALTPLGEFSVTHAYFGAQTYCGECVAESNVALVYLLTEPTPADSYDLDVEEMLVLDLRDAFTGPFGTIVDGGTLESVRDGVSMETHEASFQLEGPPSIEALAEPFEEASTTTISGSIVVQNADWSVDLVFEAGYCPASNTGFFCE